MLEMKHIHKKFPGVYALKDINFELRTGEVHALLGENGAGKSTLIKVLGGIYTADEGEIIINGKKVNIDGVKAAQANGVAIIHQELVLVPYMTVAENIFLGREPMSSGFVDKKKMNHDAQKLLDDYQMGIQANQLIKELTIAQQQMVEIVKAISYNSKILVMDEPTSSISDKEVAFLFKTMRSLTSKGVGIIYISHKMSELEEICDRVTVMRDGEYVGTEVVKNTTKDALIAMMVGRDVNFVVDKKPAKTGDVVLSVRNMTVASKQHKNNAVNHVSFDVRRGEIVCIAGIDGNGQSELVYGLSGLEPVKEGTITMNGQDITNMPIRRRITSGMSHIPEDRHKHGLVLDYSLEDNIVLERYFEPQFTNRFGFLKRKEIRKYANRLIKQYDIRSGQGPVTKVRSMSGGNQQKALIAREIDKDPKFLIAVQPTRGLDVGAIEYIHKQIVAERDAGKGVLLVSLELDEVMNVSDRILVMYEGEIVGEFDPKKVSVEELGLYMAGSKRKGIKENG